MSTTKSGGRRTESADAGRDRQRNRNERGVRSTRQVSGRAAPGDKLPSPPRERRPAMAALAVLLIVGGAAVAGLLALRTDSRVPVLVVSRDISVGEEITRDDLASVQVSADGLDLVPASGADTVIGSFAAENIPSGRALEVAMLSSDGLFTEGEVGVAVNIPAGRSPSLSPGDYVQVIQVLDGESTVLVDRAMVYDVFGGTAPQTGLGEETVTTVEDGGAELLVSSAEGPQVAAANAADQLSFVLVESGS